MLYMNSTRINNDDDDAMTRSPVSVAFPSASFYVPLAIHLTSVVDTTDPDPRPAVLGTFCNAVRGNVETPPPVLFPNHGRLQLL